MWKRMLLVGMMCFLSVAALAEDWQEAAGGTEYDCDLLAQALEAVESEDPSDMAALGREAFARTGGGTEINLYEYMGLVAATVVQIPNNTLTPDILFLAPNTACNPEESSSSNASSNASGEVLFNVVVNDGANLRSCPGTNCDVVRQARAGEILAVLAVDGEWYEVKDEDGPAFIADFLVSRGPDVVIDVDDGYEDEELGCIIVFDIKRGDTDLNIVMAGSNQDDLVVDLFRPNTTTALPVEAQLDKTFIDTNDPYVLQYYRYNTSWPLGDYKLEVELNGVSRLFGFEMEEKGDYTIHIYCD
jgi:hypothetical protein